MSQWLSPEVLDSFVEATCVVLGAGGVPLWAAHAGDVRERNAIEAIATIEAAPGSCEASIGFRILNQYFEETRVRDDVLACGLTKFALLARPKDIGNDAFYCIQDALQRCIERDLRSMAVTLNFRDEFYESALPFMLATAPTLDALGHFLGVSMLRFDCLMRAIATRPMTPSFGAWRTLATFHRGCYRKLGLTGEFLPNAEVPAVFQEAAGLYNRFVQAQGGEAEGVWDELKDALRNGWECQRKEYNDIWDARGA
jgi:hypothetical protein